ncbi:MAG: hypothetical protein M3Y24_02115 [Acidobacteriota bacterium]|nr:hypothetical protein [Acidobacteriota bacterium]
MFERYTEKAKRSIFFARYEASVFGSPYIEAEHLLLGIMREDRVLFARVLPKPGEVMAMSEQLRASLKKNDQISTSVDLPLTELAKRSLAYGAEEAERLAHKHIDTAHLLLGLLRVESSLSEFLRDFGLELDAVRRAIAASTSSAAEALIASMASARGLQNRFASVAQSLTPDVEPAPVFKLNHSPQADTK